MSFRLRALCAAFLIACGMLGSLPVRAAPEIPGTESSAPMPQAQLQGAALLAALQRGGYVLYFRHTATDFSRNDSGMRSLRRLRQPAPAVGARPCRCGSDRRAHPRAAPAGG